MFTLTYIFDFCNAPKTAALLTAKGIEVDPHGDYAIDHKTNFVPRVGDTVTHYVLSNTDDETIELNGEVFLVHVFIEEEQNGEVIIVNVEVKDDED